VASFDIIILGGGPAGYVCAIRAAQLGLSTAVVEKDKLGGVCVNIGCIPTKALLHSASSINLIAHQAKDLGIEVGAVKTDYGVAMKRSRKVSEQNSKGVEFLMKKNKVTVIKGTGTLLPGRKVKVGGDTYEAKKAVVIATGSRVKGIPQIGLDINKSTVISSDEALFLEAAPKSMSSTRHVPLSSSTTTLSMSARRKRPWLSGDMFTQTFAKSRSAATNQAWSLLAISSSAASRSRSRSCCSLAWSRSASTWSFCSTSSRAAPTPRRGRPWRVRWSTRCAVRGRRSP